eukprot:g6781.t1
MWLGKSGHTCWSLWARSRRWCRGRRRMADSGRTTTWRSFDFDLPSGKRQHAQAAFGAWWSVLRMLWAEAGALLGCSQKSGTEPRELCLWAVLGRLADELRPWEDFVASDATRLLSASMLLGWLAMKQVIYCADWEDEESGEIRCECGIPLDSSEKTASKRVSLMPAVAAAREFLQLMAEIVVAGEVSNVQKLYTNTLSNEDWQVVSSCVLQAGGKTQRYLLLDRMDLRLPPRARRRMAHSDGPLPADELFREEAEDKQKCGQTWGAGPRDEPLFSALADAVIRRVSELELLVGTPLHVANLCWAFANVARADEINDLRKPGMRHVSLFQSLGRRVSRLAGELLPQHHASILWAFASCEVKDGVSALIDHMFPAMQARPGSYDGRQAPWLSRSSSVDAFTWDQRWEFPKQPELFQELFQVPLDPLPVQRMIRASGTEEVLREPHQPLMDFLIHEVCHTGTEGLIRDGPAHLASIVWATARFSKPNPLVAQALSAAPRRLAAELAGGAAELSEGRRQNIAAVVRSMYELGLSSTARTLLDELEALGLLSPGIEELARKRKCAWAAWLWGAFAVQDLQLEVRAWAGLSESCEGSARSFVGGSAWNNQFFLAFALTTESVLLSWIFVMFQTRFRLLSPNATVSGSRTWAYVIWAFGIVRALSAALLFCGSRTVGAVSYLLVAMAFIMVWKISDVDAFNLKLQQLVFGAEGLFSSWVDGRERSRAARAVAAGSLPLARWALDLLEEEGESDAISNLLRPKVGLGLLRHLRASSRGEYSQELSLVLRLCQEPRARLSEDDELLRHGAGARGAALDAAVMATVRKRVVLELGSGLGAATLRVAKALESAHVSRLRGCTGSWSRRRNYGCVGV